MSIYALKPKFQALLRPLVTLLANQEVSANHVTLAACALSLIIGLGVAVGLYYGYLVVLLLLPLFLLLRMAMNAIDGMLAREFNQQSALGGYLNELTDVVSDAALYLPLLWLPNVSAWLIGVLVWLATVSEMAGVLGQVHGNGRRYDGPMGKSDRAFWLGLLAFLWWWLPTSLDYANLALLLINLLLVWTLYRRIQQGLQPSGVSS